jgi:hypothetical protein
MRWKTDVRLLALLLVMSSEFMIYGTISISRGLETKSKGLERQ